ncbi:hypothetical protein [Photobacterium leiognathi]|uniref:hypothetical protein n=1 Tax=Photobacterium leiognathi TaxID=553611 RepID=UPI0027399C9A|nr:hypothetical protein [Photobacterium leiognathi]
MRNCIVWVYLLSLLGCSTQMEPYKAAEVVSVDSSLVHVGSPQNYADDVENLTNDYLQALKEQNYKKLANLMDTDSIKSLHDMFIVFGTKAEAEGKFDEVRIGPFSKYKNAAQFENASVQEFYANFIQMALEKEPKALEIFSKADFKYIGVVSETKQNGYAVYKLKLDIDGYELEVADLLPITFRDGKVTASMPEEMEAFTTAIKKN